MKAATIPAPLPPVKVSCSPAQAVALLELFQRPGVLLDGDCGRAVRRAIVLFNLRGKPPGAKLITLPGETAAHLAIVVARVPKTLAGEELLGPLLDELQKKGGAV